MVTVMEASSPRKVRPTAVEVSVGCATPNTASKGPLDGTAPQSGLIPEPQCPLKMFVIWFGSGSYGQ